MADEQSEQGFNALIITKKYTKNTYCNKESKNVYLIRLAGGETVK